jgi:hypothetical protein
VGRKLEFVFPTHDLQLTTHDFPKMPQLLDILIPAAVSLVILLISWQPWTAKNVPGRWGGPIALAAGFVCMYKPINGTWPTLPPNGTTGWIFYIAIVAALFGLLDALTNSRLRWIGIVIILGGCFCVFLRGQWSVAETRNSAIVWIVASTLVATLWMLVLEHSPTERIVAPLVMLLVALFSSALLIMAHSIIYGRRAMALAGAVIPTVALITWRSRIDVRGSTIVFAAVLGALLIGGNFFADLTLWSVALVAAAPLALLISRVPIIRRRRAWARAIICILAAMLPLVLAVALALPEFLRSMANDAGGYGQ